MAKTSTDFASQVVTRRVFLKCLVAPAFCSRSAGGLCRKTTATKLVTYWRKGPSDVICRKNRRLSGTMLLLLLWRTNITTQLWALMALAHLGLKHVPFHKQPEAHWIGLLLLCSIGSRNDALTTLTTVITSTATVSSFLLVFVLCRLFSSKLHQLWFPLFRPDATFPSSPIPPPPKKTHQLRCHWVIGLPSQSSLSYRGLDSMA